MAKSIEIIVKKAFISAKATELKNISKSVALEKITNKYTNSTGNTIDSMNLIIDELNSLGSNLADLMSKNAGLVSEIALKFSQMDESIASKYHG